MKIAVYVFILPAVIILPVWGQQESAPTEQPDKKSSQVAGHETDKQIDPNTPSEESEILPAVPLHPDPDLSPDQAPGPGQPEKPNQVKWERPGEYWQWRYHPQVTQRVFAILDYPYHYGGRGYPLKDLSVLAPVVKPATSTSTRETATETENNSSSAEEKKGRGDPNSVTHRSVTPEDLNELRFALERCCDLIHQWRSLNESAGATLEIVRSIELTRTSTKIYRVKPKLAVRVKRTIGQIGSMNRKFDLVSRMAMQTILNGQIDKILFSRMEKQLADLRSMMDRLAEQNDQIGVVLGSGKLDRTAPQSEPVNYSNLELPPTDSLLK
ncbi:MAG: hypothetical protein KAJ52_02140 [Sedimentisphaerales bacterium]|nr:hypothetical protein [Sedimentisphaerales bacterium]